MTEEYPNIEDEADGVAPDEALLVEYQEVGAEWRNYENLLNQSYYLTAIVFTFFAGAFANLFQQESYGVVALLGLLAAVVFLILGLSGRAYHERRQSASRLRTKIAEELHELTNSKVPRIQKVVVGGGRVRFNKRESEPTIWVEIPLYRLSFFTSIGWLFLAGYILLSNIQ